MKFITSPLIKECVVEFDIDGTKFMKFKANYKMCKNGFHFCNNIESTLNYYEYNKDFNLMEIEPLGDILNNGDKFATNKIKILKIYSHKQTRELLGTVGYKFDKNDNIISHKYSDMFEEFYQKNKNNENFYFINLYNNKKTLEYDKNNRLFSGEDNLRFEIWNKNNYVNKLIHNIDFSKYI